MRIRLIFSIIFSLTHLLFNLLVLWLTLRWKVWKARKSFEKQLIRQGMAKRDAEKLGAKYVALRDEVENAFKQSLESWR